MKLLSIGIAAMIVLMSHGITHAIHEKTGDLGLARASAQQTYLIPLPPFRVVAGVGGIALLLLFLPDLSGQKATNRRSWRCEM